MNEIAFPPSWISPLQADKLKVIELKAPSISNITLPADILPSCCKSGIYSDDHEAQANYLALKACGLFSVIPQNTNDFSATINYGRK